MNSIPEHPTPPPTWRGVHDQLADDLRALDALTLHHDDLARLVDLGERLHDVLTHRQQQTAVETAAAYAPEDPGGWFRTLNTAGEGRSSSTLTGALARARREAVESGRDVLVEQWSPVRNQDPANRGWSMVEVVRP